MNPSPSAESKTSNARIEQKVLASEPVVLSARGLRKAFGGQVVLDGVDLELRRGEVVLLRGANGSGKTTLLNILSGALEPDAGSLRIVIDKNRESFVFPRRWWQELNPFDHFSPERVSKEGMVRTWQDLRLFADHSLLQNVAVAAQKQPGESPWTAIGRPRGALQSEINNLHAAEETLGRFGLADRKASLASQISIGQAKRVAIARALHANAQILLLDEPLSGLDSPGTDSVIELIRSLAAERRVSIVIVEHAFNIRNVLQLAHSVWTLEGGQAISTAPEECLGSDTLALSGGVHAVLAAHLSDATQRQTLHLPGSATLTVFRRASRSPTPRHPVLALKSVMVSRNARRLFGTGESLGDGTISFEIFPDDVALLEAPNGWGKTSLMEAVLGLVEIQGGEILLNGARIDPLPTWERTQRRIAYLPARNAGFPNLTVQEQVRLATVPTSAEIDPFMKRRVDSLSGGELRRLSVACLPRQPSLALLDEPFLALDAKAILSSESLNNLWRQTGTATLISMPSCGGT